METFRIEIVNKKAKSILKGLADLNLINIWEEGSEKSFQSLVTKLRSKKGAPSFEEISKEVESVRNKRYAKKA